MGSGVAKAIRARWPEVYNFYKSCHEDSRGLHLGDVQSIAVGEHKYIFNCMTQTYYGYDQKAYASLPAIRNTLTSVAEMAKFNNYSVALPPIGCGLGGLDWKEVGPIIEKIFTDAGVEFQVYDYRAENWRT